MIKAWPVQGMTLSTGMTLSSGCDAERTAGANESQAVGSALLSSVCRVAAVGEGFLQKPDDSKGLRRDAPVRVARDAGVTLSEPTWAVNQRLEDAVGAVLERSDRTNELTTVRTEPSD